jgi:Asp-tRNA(Asn)/Glu-tRNA(Gln) amidotransferase A subunit family amidase
MLKRTLSSPYQHKFANIVSLVRNLAYSEEVAFDWSSYLSASDLVYNGAFVAERAAFLQEALKSKPKVALHPVTQKVVNSANSMSASDAFRDIYEAQRLSKLMEAEFDKCDILIVPTAPNHPTIAEIEHDPIRLNLKLGVFASAVNVLDLAAIAIPAGHVEGLPFGISVIGPAFREGFIMTIAQRIQARLKHFVL